MIHLLLIWRYLLVFDACLQGPATDELGWVGGKQLMSKFNPPVEGRCISYCSSRQQRRRVSTEGATALDDDQDQMSAWV